MNYKILKTRFLQTSQSAQLESLALNLTRIQLLADSGTGESVAEHLVRESQFFIEWTVATINLEVSLEQAVKLADLQRLLSQWKLGWSDWWGDDQKRQDMAKLAHKWCALVQTGNNSDKQYTYHLPNQENPSINEHLD